MEEEEEVEGVEVVAKVNDDEVDGFLGDDSANDESTASRMKRLASLSLSLSASPPPSLLRFGGGQNPTAPQASSASNDSSAAMALGRYSLAISLHFCASSLGSMPHAVSSAKRITWACVSGSAMACWALVQAQRQTSQAGLASGSSARGEEGAADSVLDGIGILLSSSVPKTPTMPSGMPFFPPRASAKEGSDSVSARATAARRRATAEERAIVTKEARSRREREEESQKKELRSELDFTKRREGEGKKKPDLEEPRAPSPLFFSSSFSARDHKLSAPLAFILQKGRAKANWLRVIKWNS